MTEILQTIVSKPRMRRLTKEYDELVLIYDRVIIETNDRFDTIFIITNFDYGRINKYSFILPVDYPFVPPTIYVNNKSYKQFLLIPQRFNKVLKYITGINCLCCSSFCSRTNWSPAYTVKRILTEIERYNEVKFQIAWKLLADKVKEKYLIADIDIDSWLFPIAYPGMVLQL